MKRILNKLIKLYSNISYITVTRSMKKHSHLSEMIETYQVYMSDYKFTENNTHFTPEFNTLKELEQYLKENVTNYK